MGHDCEYCPEYVKNLIARGITEFDQLDVLISQKKQLDLLSRHCDLIVTDSPLLNAKIYGGSYKYKKELFSLSNGFYSEFKNFNILVKPCYNINKYKDSLRLHSYKESLDLYSSFSNLIYYDLVLENLFNVNIENISLSISKLFS